MLTIYFDELKENKQVINLTDAFFREHLGKLDRICKEIAHDISGGKYHSILITR